MVTNGTSIILKWISIPHHQLNNQIKTCDSDRLPPKNMLASSTHSEKKLNDQGNFLLRQTRCFTVIQKGEEDSLDHIFEGINFRKFQEANGTRWAPTSYKWSYLVGAQPPPSCSFARHLVGKMVIHCSFARH